MEEGSGEGKGKEQGRRVEEMVGERREREGRGRG